MAPKWMQGCLYIALFKGYPRDCAWGGRAEMLDVFLGDHHDQT